MSPRETAWADIHSLLPDGWRVSAASFGTHRWTVACRSPKYKGRLRGPAVAERRGRGRVGAALGDLAIQLRELRAAERRMALEEKARAAFLHGAEQHSRATLGRPLTQDELTAILKRYE